VSDAEVPPPVPDDLLLPLIEEAADVLRSLDAIDVPNSLRPIHGFDRRGLLAGPGRRQLLRALEHDDRFRTTVVERFCAREEVAAMADAWSPQNLDAAIEDADARHDLPLLASMLWASRPVHADYALGVITARFAHARFARDGDDLARAQTRELAAVDEARRRAEAARLVAETESARLQTDLAQERASRRSRETDAAAGVDAAQQEVARLEEALRAAEVALNDERFKTARAAKRADALDEDVKRLRGELEAARAATDVEAFDTRSVRAIEEAAADAERVGRSLRAVARQAQTAASRPRPAAPRPAKSAPTGRAQPALPGGLVASSNAGIEAMLRTPDVMFIVDGYNVTKQAWPDATAADQRERLGISITALNRRLGCNVVVVFDGDSSGIARPPLRRGGVRVVFSDAGEQADDVVVAEVAALPKRVPVVVASSDAWVREHAEAEGAVVVSAAALIELLRPAR
jgi:predicted RNA-binding protein with PIN domain